MINENNKAEEWEEVKLDDICLKITDGSHFSPPKVTKGYPMFSVKDMMENKFKLENAKQISKKNYLKLSKADCRPLKNDVLIAKDGSYLKHIFYCKENLEAVVLSSIAILRPNTDIIVPVFLQYLLRNPYVKQIMRSYVSGVAIPRIILSDFKKVKIKLPPLPQQKKIADILSAYDDLIANNNRRIKILENMAAELYTEWFVRFRFPNYENASFQENGLPNGWEYVKLDKVFQLKNGKMTKRNNKGQYKVFGSNGVIGYTNSYNAENSLIIGRVGVCGSVYWVTKKFWASDNSIIAIPRKGMSNIYVGYYVLRNLNMKRFAGGSAQPLLNQSTIAMLKIIEFPFALTEHFYNIVNPLFQQIQVLQQKNTFLQQERDLLLPRLLSGKLLH